MTIEIKTPSKLPEGCPKLTPTMKKVYARAIELVDEMWIKGQYLMGEILEDGYRGFEAGTETDFDKGWVNGSVRPIGLCAVGGIQRATWEVLGKPDMSKRLDAKAQRVNRLADDAEERTDALVLYNFGDGYIGDLYANSTINFNDETASNKEDVIALLKAAGNLA